MGAASAVVAFFRSMGGSIGVSALGAVLSHQVADKVSRGLAALGIAGRRRDATDPRPGHAAGAGPRGLRARLRRVATGHLFLVAVPFAVVALVCVLFIQEVPLREHTWRTSPARPRPRARGDGGAGAGERPRSGPLHALEHEVGVLIRRVTPRHRRAGRAVHPDLQPSSYLMLAYLVEAGPRRSADIAEAFDIDKGAVSRARCSTSSTSAWSSARRIPTTAAPRSLAATTRGDGRVDQVSRPGSSSSTSGSASGPPRTSTSWSSRFSRYNATLDER